MEDPKIKQIIPADGWIAVHGQEAPPHYWTVRLVCWALMVDGFENEYVVGMAHYDTLLACDERDYLLGYWHKDDINKEEDTTRYWIEEGEKVARKGTK